MRAALPYCLSLFTCLALLGAPSGLPAQEAAALPSEADARRVAVAWLESLARGKVEEVLKRSGEPFSWDGKRLIEQRDELAKAVADYVAAQKSRDLQVKSAFVFTNRKDQRLAKQHFLGDDRTTVMVLIPLDGKRIFIWVAGGKQPRVVGFRG